MKNRSVLLFLLASVILFNCSNKKSADELFNEGEKFISEKKYSEALVSYETIMNGYPADTLAPQAVARLASLYQNKFVPDIPESESLHKSVELFKSIFEKYRDSEQAPMGLFMAGFIEANELKNFDSASETYNLFIKAYPDHDLTVSAKEELENMGLTPEEILQKNLSRQK
jgi:TolA-binding protein